jgi:hypothetical protein
MAIKKTFCPCMALPSFRPGTTQGMPVLGAWSLTQLQDSTMKFGYYFGYFSANKTNIIQNHSKSK